MTICLLALGSNQGDRQANLAAAIGLLEKEPQIKLLRQSRCVESKPVGGPAGQASYLNGALLLETSLPPDELLRRLLNIENLLGRRRGERWGPRSIDLDLLLYDEAIVDSPFLKLPHPRMAFRRFVLEPAAEIAGAMLHPTIGWSIARLREHLNTSPPYIAVSGAIAVGKTRLAKKLAAALHGITILERPNWRRLAKFYAAPLAHAWDVEMQFLAQRAALLSGVSASRRWLVSDFWFEQSPAFACVWLSAARFSEYMESFRQARAAVPCPRLVIFLDQPVTELLLRMQRRGRRCESFLTFSQVEKIAEALRALTLQPEMGPILRLQEKDEARNFAEAVAAAQGME